MPKTGAICASTGVRRRRGVLFLLRLRRNVGYGRCSVGHGRRLRRRVGTTSTQTRQHHDTDTEQSRCSGQPRENLGELDGDHLGGNHHDVLPAQLPMTVEARSTITFDEPPGCIDTPIRQSAASIVRFW